MPASASPDAAPTLLESWQVLDFMVALVEKSLVVFDDADETDEQNAGQNAPRYRLLETTRQYGAEIASRNPGEIIALRRRHRAFYLRLAENAAPHLTGPNAALYLAALAADHDNLRDALRGFVEAIAEDTHALNDGARLCVALEEFWSVRGFFGEGRDFCRFFLRADDAAANAAANAATNTATPLPTILRATLSRVCGSFCGYLNEFDQAETLLQDALRLYTTAQNYQGASEARVSLGIITRHKGDDKTARTLFEQGLSDARLSGSKRAIAIALSNIAHMVKEEAVQEKMYEECLALFRQNGDKWGVARELGNLAWLKQHQGDQEAALVLYEECRIIREALGDRHGLGWLLRGVAHNALSRGDRARALAAYQEAIAIFKAIGNREGAAWMQFYAGVMPLADHIWPDNDDEAALLFLRDSLQGFVVMQEPNSARFALEGIALRLVLSDPKRAAVLWGVSEKIRTDLEQEESTDALMQKAQQVAREALGESAWNEAFAHGLEIPTGEAVALALNDLTDNG